MVNSDQNILIEFLSFYDVSDSFEVPWLSNVQFGFISIRRFFAIKAFFSHFI